MMSDDLLEFEFVFTVICGTDVLCPGDDNTSVVPLRALKEQIDQNNNIEDLAIRRHENKKLEDGLLEIGYYGSSPLEMDQGTYQRDVFVGVAKAKAFKYIDGKLDVPPPVQGQITGYDVLKDLFRRIFKDLPMAPDDEGNTFGWLTWVVVPLPDGVFDGFRFGEKGGSSKG